MPAPACTTQGLSQGSRVWMWDVGNVTQGWGLPDHKVVTIGCAQHTRAFCQLFGGFSAVQCASVLYQSPPVGPGCGPFVAGGSYRQRHQGTPADIPAVQPRAPFANPTRYGTQNTGLFCGFLLLILLIAVASVSAAAVADGVGAAAVVVAAAVAVGVAVAVCGSWYYHCCCS